MGNQKAFAIASQFCISSIFNIGRIRLDRLGEYLNAYRYDGALDAYSGKWLDSIGYEVIRHSSQRQRALNSDYKSIFPRAEADVYITTDSTGVVVDK